MAQIHTRVLQEAKSTAAGKGRTPFDLEAVRGRFSPDELDAISEGYKLLAEEGGGDDDGGDDEGGDVDDDSNREDFGRPNPDVTGKDLSFLQLFRYSLRWF